jgi:hypothetical protein
MCLHAHRAGHPKPRNQSAFSQWLASARITYLALEIIITCKQESSRDREGNGCDTANWLRNLVTGSAYWATYYSDYKSYLVRSKFAIGADVEKTARCVVRTSTKSVSVGEELNSVDVGVVGGEGLDTLLLADIPQLSKGVAGTRHELVVVERVDAQAHDIAEMVGKLVHLGARLEVPEHAGHVARRGEDALVADESAATEVARVAGQLSCDARGAFPC